MLLNGGLANGAVASVHVGAIPFAGSGYRMEIYGREGTLVATGEDSPQLGRVLLLMGRSWTTNSRHCLSRSGSSWLRLVHRQANTSNVGQMYALFAEAIGDGISHQPTFETAVDLHRLIDAVRQSSDGGCEVKFGQTPH